MREVCFVIDKDGRLLWSDTTEDPSALRDSRLRWEAIWNTRDQLEEIAHSHPTAPACFSSIDESTMEALTAALGKAPIYSVVSQTGMRRRVENEDVDIDEEPWWADLLRLASGMHTKVSRGG